MITPSVLGSTKVCAVIGDPVAHSLSPKLHNEAFRALGLERDFIFVAFRVRPDSLTRAIAGARAFGLRGLSCTLPHKQAALSLIDQVDPAAKAIGAVNTIVNEDGTFIGSNTDYLGIATPLSARINPLGKRALILGAGGAARAAIYALVNARAEVTITNRTIEKACALSDEFGCALLEKADAAAIEQYDIVINATSVGMEPHLDQSPLPPNSFRPGQLIFDTVYTPHKTKLLHDARNAGATVIHGIEMFLHQAAAQFTLYTKKEAPLEVMQRVLYEHYNIHP